MPVGTYRYTVTSVYRTWTASTALSTSVGVTPPGTATKLVFLTQPANSTTGVALPTQPVVAVIDVNGSIVTTQLPTLVTLTVSGGGLTGCLSAAAAVNGVATFTGCTVTGAGSYMLTATSAPLTSAVSTTFTVAGPAAQLAFTSSPSNAGGGAVFDTQPAVVVQDSSGRTVTTSTSPVTLTIPGSPADAALACAANPVTATSGRAAFTGCSVNKAGTYTLTATGAGFTTASTSFAISTGPATKLGFTTQPSGSTGSVPFGTQPAVSIQDAGGNTVTTSTHTVDLTLTGSSGAVLSCAASAVAAVNGVAAFTGCSIDKTGTYTLTATSAGLIFTVSNTTVIAAGAATKLGFTAQPSGSNGGTPFATQPVVAVQDAGGNTTTSTAPVTLSITGSPAGAVLSCAANPVTAAAGIAAFSGCSINTTGTYTLTATGAGFNTASLNFTISLGPATKLGFTTNPSGSTGGIAFSAQPVVAVQDAGGNTSTSTATVTLTITTPAGAALTCTTNPVTTISGVAAFSGCSINKSGTFTLTAATGSLTSAVSTSITVTAGPAAKLAFTTQPSGAAANSVFAAQPVVTIQDAGGNTVTTSTAAVTLSITQPQGANLICTASPKAPSQEG
ncbi:beta strand repeat-containing protein [Arthrobacter sp. UYCu723]